MLTVHHLEYSQSFRILWLLEEMEQAYELKLYKRDPQTKLAPSEYKKLSPLGTAPVVTHKELVLAESNAIVDYILDTWPHPTLRPEAQAPARVPYLYWFHLAQGSLMPIALTSTVFSIITERAPGILRPLLKGVFGKANAGFIKPRIGAIIQEAEKALAKGPYFAGEELTAADIVLIYPVLALEKKGQLAQAPKVQAWIKRVQARPAFARALEKDGTGSVVLNFGASK